MTNTCVPSGKCVLSYIIPICYGSREKSSEGKTLKGMMERDRESLEGEGGVNPINPVWEFIKSLIQISPANSQLHHMLCVNLSSFICFHNYPHTKSQSVVAIVPMSSWKQSRNLPFLTWVSLLFKQPGASLVRAFTSSLSPITFPPFPCPCPTITLHPGTRPNLIKAPDVAPEVAMVTNNHSERKCVREFLKFLFPRQDTLFPWHSCWKPKQSSKCLAFSPYATMFT